jgi:hypothetical protein
MLTNLYSGVSTWHVELDDLTRSLMAPLKSAEGRDLACRLEEVLEVARRRVYQSTPSRSI